MIKFFEKAGITIPVDEGIVVVSVYSDSPAANAGLQTGDQVLQIGMFQVPVGGDIIVKVDDQSITSYKELVLYLEKNTEIGGTVKVTFYRDQKKKTKTVNVGERPKQLSVKKVSTNLQQK